MDLITKTEEEIIRLLNETSREANRLYRLKQELKLELTSRTRPEDIQPADYQIQETKGVSSRQITQIKKFARERHSTEDLILFINQLIKEN